MPDDDRLRELWARVQNPPSADAALAASEQLVEDLGALAADNPATYQRQLADAWGVRAAQMDALGPRPEADEAFATAARLYRGLATDTDPESLVQLAVALQDFAKHLLKLDDRAQEALPLIEEAHDVSQRLGRDDPKLSQDTDAIVTYLHGRACYQLGDHQAALTHAEHAEAGLRRAERRDRDPEYRISLAENQRILAVCLVETSRIKDARKKIEDSAYLFGRLSKQEPDLYLAEFANAQYLNAMIMQAQGKGRRAALLYEDAAKTYTKAMQYNPLFEEDYRTTVTALVDCYTGLGDHKMAERMRSRYA